MRALSWPKTTPYPHNFARANSVPCTLLRRPCNVRAMRHFIIIATTALWGCSDFPDLSARIDAQARAADYPALLPLDPLLARADALETQGAITPASVAAFDNQIAALRAKASRLRGPVIEPAVRARMRRGVAVPAAIR